MSHFFYTFRAAKTRALQLSEHVSSEDVKGVGYNLQHTNFTKGELPSQHMMPRPFQACFRGGRPRSQENPFIVHDKAGFGVAGGEYDWAARDVRAEQQAYVDNKKTVGELGKRVNRKARRAAHAACLCPCPPMPLGMPPPSEAPCTPAPLMIGSRITNQTAGASESLHLWGAAPLAGTPGALVLLCASPSGTTGEIA